MAKSFNKYEVLAFIKSNKNILKPCFFDGDFDIFNEEHLMVVHAIYK